MNLKKMRSVQLPQMEASDVRQLRRHQLADISQPDLQLIQNYQPGPKNQQHTALKRYSTMQFKQSETHTHPAKIDQPHNNDSLQEEERKDQRHLTLGLQQQMSQSYLPGDSLMARNEPRAQQQTDSNAYYSPSNVSNVDEKGGASSHHSSEASGNELNQSEQQSGLLMFSDVSRFKTANELDRSDQAPAQSGGACFGKQPQKSPRAL